MSDFRTTLQRLRQWLSQLSFRTGLTVGAIALVCYAISFLQMFLPISIAAKGAIWTLFFGLAKAAQYSALLILGKEGISRIRASFSRESR